MEHDECRDDPRRPAPRSPAEPRFNEALERQPAAVQGAPGEKFPSRAMPQPAEQHRQQEVAVGLKAAMAGSPQSPVEIIAQSGRAWDVPPLPELAPALGPARLV